jgi:hypothetical protein
MAGVRPVIRTVARSDGQAIDGRMTRPPGWLKASYRRISEVAPRPTNSGTLRSNISDLAIMPSILLTVVIINLSNDYNKRFNIFPRYGIFNAKFLLNSSEGKMADWDFSQWLRFMLIWLAVFAGIGGIISQTNSGASGRGFLEGMWKGVEVFFIVAVIIGVIYGVLVMMGVISTALNSSG